MRLMHWILGAVLVLIAGAVTLGAVHMNRFLDTPAANTNGGVDFEIESGSSFGGVAADLEEQGIISSSTLLRLYARWTDQAGAIQAGEYTIEAGKNSRQLPKQVPRGQVRLYRFPSL